MAVAARELDVTGLTDIHELRSGYLGELPAAIHRHGGKKAAGAFTSAFQRILDDRFIRYFIEYEVDDHGIPLIDGDGRFRPRRDQAGQFIRYRVGDADDWVMPIHEALKRYRGDRRHPRLEYVWLKALLSWRGLPFQCLAHKATIRTADELISCLATQASVTAERVTVGILAAARSTWRILEAHQDQVAARAASTKAARWGNTDRANYKPRQTGTTVDRLRSYPVGVHDLGAAKRAGGRRRLPGATYPQDGSNGQAIALERAPKRRLFGLASARGG